jgi:hypothetical protein
MASLSKKELVVFTGVGVGLSALSGMVLPPLAVGTLMYVSGIWIGSQKRPEEGYFSGSHQLTDNEVFEEEEYGALALTNPGFGMSPVMCALALAGAVVAYNVYQERGMGLR